MSDDDDKKRVTIEDLPVPLKDLDKEEQENVTGGLDAVSSTISPNSRGASDVDGRDFLVWQKSGPI